MTDTDETLAPAEAFAALGDETRVAIVETLAEAVAGEGEDGLTFSELRKRVGVEDAGQFNYHLDELRGQFVAKRDGKYRPQHPALQAVVAIKSGTYTDRSSRTATLDRECPLCGGQTEATYDDGFVEVSCLGEHDRLFGTRVPPAAAADRSVEDVVTLAAVETNRDVARAIDGTCFLCWGSTTVERFEHDGDEPLHANLSCDNCWLRSTFPVAAAIVTHPAVVSLYHRHGRDVRTEWLLSLEFVRDPDATTVVSTDPYRVRVDVSVGEDAVALTLDDDLNVVSVEES